MTGRVNKPGIVRASAVALWALVCLLTLVPREASGGIVAPAVQKAIDELGRAKGPEVYTSLREIWSLWDRTDPIWVEQALRQASSDPKLSKSQRAYAQLLSAYGRIRRGDIATAKTQIAQLGFVQHWLVIGPFDNDGKSGFPRVFDPESRLHEPLDLQRGCDGKERAVRWRAAPDSYAYGWLNLGDMMRPSEGICAYATTFVRARDDRPRQASIWAGATGALRVFWNGEQVLEDRLYRSVDADRLATTVSVKRGWNRLTVKVCGDASAPMLSIRLADAEGGPDAALEVSAIPELSAQAASNATRPVATAATSARITIHGAESSGSVQAAGAPPVRSRDPGRVQGPLQLFEKAVSGANPAANDLQAYARYLLLTGGDDPAEHLARDLASRAAERSPSVERMLLAADLAQDRNQELHWVQRAQQLAKSPNVELLLARARLARTGPNWREAVPFYDQVLQLDPDNITAMLGRVELYDKAGLRRAALSMLEQAVERNPRSVALLRMLALRLASLGRHTEAAEVESRYAAFRFDDPTLHIRRLELAIARGDKQLAEHWVHRMLDAEPPDARHLSIAARAYAAMGKPNEALATYERALRLAPEDTETMRELADYHGELGAREKQLALMRQILVLRPQFKEVREYVEHIEPRERRADEAYAWEPDQFLPLRHADGDGFNRRVLRDLQVTTVYPSGLSSTFRQIVFQPLTDEAAAAAREYAFAYQADRQVVQLRASRVFRADGRVDEAIERAEGPADDPSIAMYTSGRTYYVHFPKLNVGDVVELRYRIEDVSSENAFADYFGEIRYMQSSVPTHNAEYVVIAPATRALHIETTGLDGLQREIKTQGANRIYRFTAPQIAPVFPEPNMPPWPEVMGHVHVSTYRTWDDVGRWYWGLSRDQLTPDDQIRRKTEELTKGLANDEDKIRAIYNYVVQRTRYVALEFGIYGFKPRPAALTLARGWGDCKDKAALIVSMLKVAGIPANLVLVRSSMRGDFPTAPASLAPFDHAIAYVPGHNLYLDGTAEWAGSKEFPAFDRGAMALVVSENGGKLVRLPDPLDTGRKAEFKATLRADGSAKLSMDYEVRGALAAEWRARYHGESTRRDRVARDVARNMPGFALDAGAAGLEVNALDDLDHPPRLIIRGTAPAYGRREGAVLSVPVTPADRFVSSFAGQSKRTLDIKLNFPTTIEETRTVQIPAGMRVRSLPQPSQVESPFGSYVLESEHKDGVVTVRVQVKFSRSRVSAGDYRAFASFCEQVDRALDQRLILEGR